MTASSTTPTTTTTAGREAPEQRTMEARQDGSGHGAAAASTSAVAAAAAAAGPTFYGFPVESLNDASALPDFYTDFLRPEDVEAFIQALAGPDPLQSPPPGAAATDDGLRSPVASLDHLSRRASTAENGDTAATTIGDGTPTPASTANGASRSTPGTPSSLFITAKNDWAPVYEKVVPSTDGPEAPAAEAARPAVSAPQPPSSARWSFLGRKKDAALATPVPASVSQIPTLQAPRRRRHLQQRPKQRQRIAAASAASAASAAAGKRTRAKPGPGRRTQDETREGYLYGLLKWPFLLGVFAWIIGLSIAYLVTRLYVSSYEQLVTWRGRREKLRQKLRSAPDYRSWVAAAEELDAYLGNDRWREDDEFAFYDFRTVRRVAEQLRRCRAQAQTREAAGGTTTMTTANSGAARASQTREPVGDLKALVEACVKNNFAGVENRHLYSQTYYGTKNLVQKFIDEVERSLRFLSETKQIDAAEKRSLFRRLHANYGRTALCLSGGASFAYYHFGVVKALLEQDVLPDVITGTSGGALVAALVATRTNDELRQLLVPALAGRLTACAEPFTVWIPRWWRTGARFDSVDWARRCAWWTRGSMTFREAYERTGRILNVSCVPADPHSPTILCNYRTAPDCVIWSAVLASAAVPGILNPVVLMMKTTVPGEASGSSNYRLVPYSFGHKWKDGSLRTDIPLKALNLHFNVNFTVVSQVNPHVNLFFFSSRGSVGQPVTHRKGRGWRGGYLGSASEEYFKQDLRKWLKLLRNLELLPRPLGQDWSQLWLQPFSGTVTIWPKSVPYDFLKILSDPDPTRLAHMLHEGCQSAFPPLQFVSNRLRIERLVERGRLASRLQYGSDGGAGSSTGGGDTFWSGHHVGGGGGGSVDPLHSDDELRVLLASNGAAARRFRSRGGLAGLGLTSTTATSDENISLSSSSASDADTTAPRRSGGVRRFANVEVNGDEDDEDDAEDELAELIPNEKK